MAIFDSEIGCEHRRGDLVAVGAIANENIDQSWALSWKCELHSAAEASSRCFILLGPAVSSQAGDRNVRFRFVCGSGHDYWILYLYALLLSKGSRTGYEIRAVGY